MRVGAGARARWGVLLALALLASVPAATAIPYLQEGFDAARTGATTDPGPQVFDQAFSVQLDGSVQNGAPPLLIDGRVYALVSGQTQVAPSALYRVDLDTAQVEQLTNLTTRSSSLASDGERLFVAEGNRTAAYTLEGEGPLWAWTFPDILTDDDALPEDLVDIYECSAGAVLAGTFYLACAHGHLGSGVVLDDAEIDSESRSFVVALDTETGEPRWTWVTPEAGPSDQLAEGSVSPSRDSGYQTALKLAVNEERTVLVTGVGPIHDDGAYYGYRMWGLNTTSGELAWTNSYVEAQVGIGTDARAALSPPAIALTRDELFVKVREGIRAWNPASGNQRWGIGFDEEGGGIAYKLDNGLAVSGEQLFTTGAYALSNIDTAIGRIVWQETMIGRNWEFTPGLLVADGRVFGARWEGQTPDNRAQVMAYTVHAVQDGEPLWTRNFPHELELGNLLGHAVGEGVLVLLNEEGVLWVIGHTGASIQPQASVSDTYPAVEETVRVDLSASRPGVQSDEVEFQAVWGDGTVTPWQASPVFEHAYGAIEDRTAVFQARNPAGQTARTTVTFHVGQPEPVAPNFVETAFERDNQDLTFGVLGIAVALGGGLIAVGRRRRQRGRLELELQAIQEAYEENRSNPTACEAALAERRTHVHALLLDGKLDEGQVAILDRRLDELGRQLRMSLLDDRFQFLPHGMVLALQDMLGDGRISAWERQHVLRVLDEDEVLSAAQKDQVRRLVDEWFQRDTAGG